MWLEGNLKGYKRASTKGAMMLRKRDDGGGRVGFARGGVTGGSVLTGAIVALGAMFLLLAIVGGVLTALELTGEDVTSGNVIEATIGAGIALVVAQFIAYYWGGYTAGRMGRGAGLANGLLVPLLAIVIAAAVAGVVALLGASANLNLPFTENRLPLQNDTVVNWGIGSSIAALIAMFLGGALGGIAGAHWHTKLERRTLDEEQGAVEESRAGRQEDYEEGSRGVLPERRDDDRDTTGTYEDETIRPRGSYEGDEGQQPTYRETSEGETYRDEGRRGI